jgi:hypothetical protein
MSKLPPGFDFHGIYCYQDGRSDQWTFSYISSAPQAEIDARGKPIAQLLISNAGAILQLQTQWDTDPNQLQELLQAVIDRNPQLDGSLISLEPASVIDQGVSLLLGDGQGAVQVLETTNSSGMPPYSTIFNVTLTADEKAIAVAAFHGKSDCLLVRYQFSLEVTSLFEAIIEGDLAPEIKALMPSGSRDRKSRTSTQPSISLERCLTQIETAIAQERLALKLRLVNHISDTLKQRVEQEVKQTAAQQLFNEIKKASVFPKSSQIRVKAQKTEVNDIPFECQTDISSWFTAAAGADAIRISPVSIAEPTRTSV